MLLDLPSLQTLVAAVDLGGFGKAATRLHRSPGAVSLQLKALEDRVGSPLFEKAGRGRVLTETGELLLGFARRMLALNDEAMAAMRGAELDGDARFGMPQDFADSWLPRALAQFARAHPSVRIDIRVGCSAHMQTALRGGELDLVLAFGEGDGPYAETIDHLPVHWLAHPEFTPTPGQPLPLLLLEQPCSFRQYAIEALDRAQIPWRIALSSGSVSAIWAAADAGLGLTARSLIHVPGGLAVADKRLKLPQLPKMALSLHRDGMRSAGAADHLQTLVEEAVKSRW